MFYNSYQSAAAALEKISGVLEEQPSVPDPTRPIDLWQAKGAVSFDGVEFAYAGGRVVLPKFNLDIPAGQTIALVGSTGAGKSTLAKLISRFYDPTAGTRHAGRRGSAPAASEGPAPRDRHGHPGGVPVLRLGRGQHRARQAGGEPRRDRRGGRRRSARTSSSRRCRTATTPT